MPMSDWSTANWLAVFIMWAVMMAAMMLPTAMPMVTVFATLNRRRSEAARTVAFVAGYVALWTAFGAAATAAQWALQARGLLSPMIVSMSPALSAALLMIAGVFQFTPLKQACLRACRSPLGFLLTDWRDGLWGAARMGLRHGLYCLGCCWALMALLFVGGAMNLLVDRRAHPSRRHGEARPERRSAGQGAGRPHDRGRRRAIDLAGVVAAGQRPLALLSDFVSRAATWLRLADADHPEGQKLALLLPDRHVLADLEGVVAEAEAFLLLFVPGPLFHSNAQVEPPRPPAR